MSFISLVFGVGGPQSMIGSLPLDALLNEETRLSSNITSYPVEDGPPVTDHITQDSERLSLSGIVTAASVTMFGAGGRSKLMAAKEVLRMIHEQRLPITIVTGMDIYENFGMGDATIGRTNKGDLLTIDCELQKIRKAVTQKADIPPEQVKANDGGQPGSGAQGKAGQTGTKGGKASAQGGDAAARNKSDLAKLVGIKG